MRSAGRVAVFLLWMGSAATTLAQQPAPAPAPPPDPPKAPTTLREWLKEPDQGGGLHFTRHFSVAFGGIKQGSAMALGPAFSSKFANGSYVQLKAVYSLKHFSLLQARYDSRRFWGDRALVLSRVRWQDAPELSLYRLGMEAPDLRADFAERKTEVSSQVRVRMGPRLRFGGGFGVERFATRAGPLPLEEPESLTFFPEMPGLNTHPWFAHTAVSVGLGTGTLLDYSRSGRLVGGVFHDYRDVHGGQRAFEMYDAFAQQLVPMFAQRGVLELFGRTWLTQSGDPGSVPFYLMPTLGGGDYLRAFPTYRFRDRDAWYLKAEYRWAVHKMADVAGFYEGGEVARNVTSLDFTDMAHSVGFGIRAHSKTANLFRADVAYGREGWGFRVGLNAAGS